MARQIALAEITSAEQALYAILCKKDEQALLYLQDKYGAILYSHISRIVHEEIKASVALCETFKKIYLSLSIYDPASSGLLSWMLRIAENCALSWGQAVQEGTTIQQLAATGS